MTDGSISVQLVTFMMPILMTQILQQLYSICDTALVGRCSGPDALAGIGTASLIVSVIVNFIIGLSTGISVMISHLYGSRSYKELTCCIQTILFSMIGIGLTMTLAGFLLMPMCLRLLQTPEEIIPAASTYLGICLPGITAQLIYNAVNASLRALGNTKAALYILVISAITNLLLDILFMAVFSWGIAGAAAATVISQYLSAVMVLYVLLHLKGEWHMSLKPEACFFSQLRHFKKMMETGIPAGMQAVFMSISSLIIQTTINSFGYSAMAGMTVFARVEGFLYYPLFSFGLALTCFIGQNSGAGKWDRVDQGIHISIRLTVAGSIILACILMPLAPHIVGLFTRDPLIIQNGMQAIRYSIPFYWIYAINQVYIGAIRGLGNTAYPALTSLLSYCIFRVVWCQTLIRFFHDMRVVYTAYLASWVVMLFLLIGGYHYFARKMHPSYIPARSTDRKIHAA